MAPEDKLYTIRNITTIKRRYQRFLSIVALHDKKEINIQLNLFRENNITLFNNLIKKR